MVYAQKPVCVNYCTPYIIRLSRERLLVLKDTCALATLREDGASLAH